VNIVNVVNVVTAVNAVTAVNVGKPAQLLHKPLSPYGIHVFLLHDIHGICGLSGEIRQHLCTFLLRKSGGTV
jgi:hypothetical protein